MNDTSSPGVCSLRDAITAAHTDAAVNGCVAGAGADTITLGGLAPGQNSSMLASALPAIASELSIDGTVPAVGIFPSVSLALIPATSGFTMLTVSSGTVSLNKLNFINGVGPTGAPFGGGPGAIKHTGGALSISNATFRNNSGGGLPLDNSAGGAINNVDGNLTIATSTFDSNSSAVGGAIYNVASAASNLVLITDSNFTSNSATSNVGGGAIYSNSQGGNSATVTIGRSSFSTNTSNAASATGGAISSNNSTFSIYNSTFSANSTSGKGGAIYHSNLSTAVTLQLYNDTIANNTSTSGAGGVDIGSTVSTGFNTKNTIASKNTAPNCSASITPTGTVLSNLEFQNAGGSATCGGLFSYGDPKLDTLKSNGGAT